MGSGQTLATVSLGKGEKLVFNPDKDYLKYLSRSEAELTQLFESNAGITAKVIYKGAMIIRAAEEKGMDTSGWRRKYPGFYDFLRRVAYGSVLPGVYEFQGRLRQAVSMLPLTDQKRLVNGEAVSVLLADGDVRKILPADMEPAMVRQVFHIGRIRAIQEQQVFLDEEKLRGLKKVRVNHEDSVVVNRKLGVVIVNGPNVKLTQKDLLDLAQRLTK